MEPLDRDQPGNGRTLSELFRELSREIGTLLHQEAELARAEIRSKTSRLGAALGELGAGAFVAFAGFLVLLEAAVYALAEAIDSRALAALIVGAATLIVGALLLARGRGALRADELAPKRTLESLRQDAALAGGLARDPTGRSAG